MIEVSLNKELLIEFINDLRLEDKLEIVAILGENYKDNFIQMCLKESEFTYFLLNDNLKPLAIGGALKEENNNCAQVWLLCTNEIKYCKKDLYKYVKAKIEFFKTKFDILYNFIYKTNFESLKWLKRCGFSVSDCDDLNYKLFYFSKGDYFDIRYFTC